MSTATPPDQLPTLTFALRVQDDRAAAVAGGWNAGPALVEYLEIEIPNVSFPLDLEGGATRFQRRRGRFGQATLSVAGAALDETATAVGAELAARGIHDLRLRILDGAIEVSARIVFEDRAADLTARA